MSKITVLRVNKTVAEKGYPIIELAYKTEDDKTKGMKIFGFGKQKEVSEVAAAAQQGDVLEAVFTQNAKGYWEFASLKNTGEKQATASPAGTTTSAGGTRGNWETSDERAARQVMIVRQSSISSAVALKPKASVDEVIETAKQFEAYVFGTKQPIKQTGDVQ